MQYPKISIPNAYLTTTYEFPRAIPQPFCRPGAWDDQPCLVGNPPSAGCLHDTTRETGCLHLESHHSLHMIRGKVAPKPEAFLLKQRTNGYEFHAVLLAELGQAHHR